MTREKLMELMPKKKNVPQYKEGELDLVTAIDIGETHGYNEALSDVVDALLPHVVLRSELLGVEEMALIIWNAFREFNAEAMNEEKELPSKQKYIAQVIYDAQCKKVK